MLERKWSGSIEISLLGRATLYVYFPVRFHWAFHSIFSCSLALFYGVYVTRPCSGNKTTIVFVSACYVYEDFSAAALYVLKAAYQVIMHFPALLFQSFRESIHAATCCTTMWQFLFKFTALFLCQRTTCSIQSKIGSYI